MHLHLFRNEARRGRIVPDGAAWESAALTLGPRPLWSPRPGIGDGAAPMPHTDTDSTAEPLAGTPAPAETAPPLPSSAEDVACAYRAFFGRAPENEEVIARNRRRTPAEIAAVLARSGEFRNRLTDLAAGRLTPHAMLRPEDVAAANRWCDALVAPPPGGTEEEVPPSPARLLARLLAAPVVQAELAALPDTVGARIATVLADPSRTALHRLTRHATAEDARHLAHLLEGPAPADTAQAPPDGMPLFRLVRAQVDRPDFAERVLRPAIKGQLLPVFGLDATAADGCAAWLEERLGVEPPPAGPDRLFAGALLHAFLAHPLVDAALARVWPAEREALLPALPALASGAQHLLAQRTTAEDVAHAYLAVLGRPAENAAVRRANEGMPLQQLLGAQLASNEFRAHVLGRLAAGEAVPHHALSPEQRRLAGGFLGGRLGLHARPGAPAPLHPMALLARLLSLPAIEAELKRLHGVLWADAQAAMEAWLAEGARGGIGAIDYVTGDWIVGWAADRRARPGDPPLEVEILCNGALAGLGRADRPRPGAAAEEGAAGLDCGFRIAWRGRSRLRAEAAGAYRFQIRDAASGEAIGPPFQLDSAFVEPRTTLQMLAGELRQARATLRRLEAMLPQLESFTAFPPEEHAAFRRQYRVLPPDALPEASGGPDFRILVPGEGVSVRGLRRVLDSLQRQSWARWTALVLPADAEQQALAETAAARDPRFTLRAAATGDVPAEHAAARDLAEGAAALVLLLTPGAMLEPAALAWFAHAATRFPEARGFYADEDAVREEAPERDRHEAPVLRAALDHWDLPRRNPCGDILCAPAAALAEALAEVPPALDRTGQRWVAWAALARRGRVAHIPRLLASVQADALEGAEPAAAAPPCDALRPLLRRPWLLPDAPPEPDGDARISVVIPTRNGGALLEDCTASLRGKAAAPEALDVILVDNGSDRAETLDWLAAREAAGRIRVLRIDEPFNWSRLNNRAVAEAARGEILLFLNDDTRMLTDGWDARLRRLLSEPDVGAVGARLAYEDLTLQHGGVVFGTEGLAAHEGVGAGLEEGGPLGRWQALRAVGAVTGAFLACRREVFERVGPFDEHGLGVTFNDVDLCLRLRAAGLDVLYAPEIALVHYESKTRGLDDLDPRKQERAAFERRMLVERWGEAVLLDPGFNPHWSRWTRPFAAIREPSPAEIDAHLAASASPRPWNPLLRAASP